MRADALLDAGRAVSDAGGVTIGFAVGTPAALALGAGLTSFRWAVNSVNTALIFMMLVVAVAALGGRAAGVITAMASVMSYDFFHTEPYLSMAIESRDDIETTVLLLVAGLFVGTIANRCRSALRRETVTRLEARRVHRVAEAAATGRPSAAVLEVAQSEITALLDLASCSFEPLPYGDDQARPRLGRNGAVEAQTRFRFRRDRSGRVGFELPPDGVELPVLARGHHVGRLVLVPNPHTAVTVDDRLMTVAIADQLGAAWLIPPKGASVLGDDVDGAGHGGAADRGAHPR
jgi:hypothetical protein